VSEARRPDAIARDVRNEILRGRYRPGERLPSERELAEQAGVNRGSAREALKILAQQRLIEIQPGGSRVIPVHRASLDVLAHLVHAPGGPDAALMAQLLDVHELLLTGALRLAVERASEEERARALALLDTMKDERTREDEYLRAMAALVELIAEASRNLVLRMVGNALLVILASVVPALRRTRPPHAMLAHALAPVRRALVKRDPDAAERGIRSLLRVQREHVLKEIEAAAAAPGRQGRQAGERRSIPSPRRAGGGARE
jgi:GntR family transcriptional repressor for pyruvate dehydrogenase complex